MTEEVDFRAAQNLELFLILIVRARKLENFVIATTMTSNFRFEVISVCIVV